LLVVHLLWENGFSLSHPEPNDRRLDGEEVTAEEVQGVTVASSRILSFHWRNRLYHDLCYPNLVEVAYQTYFSPCSHHPCNPSALYADWDLETYLRVGRVAEQQQIHIL
jgi:hypothetical protein